VPVRRYLTRRRESNLVAQVSVDDGLVRADLGYRAAGDDLAVGHNVDPVGQSGQERDVMLDEQDADSVGAQLADDTREPLRQRGLMPAAGSSSRTSAGSSQSTWASSMSLRCP